MAAGKGSCRDAAAGMLWRRSPAGEAGFTLLEILLAVALIGLLATTLISISWNMIGDRAQTPEEVFWQATQEARKVALETEREARLSYDEKTKSFVLADGAASRSFPVPPVRDLEISFIPAGQPGRSSVLIGGQLVDTRSLPFVSFFTDGTCQPFRVQFRTGGGPARTLAIDPWTCAQVIVSAGPTP